MKKKIFFCCVFLMFFVLVIVTGHFLLKPMAKIGDDTVRAHELIRYAMSERNHIAERMADDIAFEKLVSETGVTASDEEIKREMEALGKDSGISYKTCLKSVLHQKIINKFALEYRVSADDARSYYEKNKEQYGDTEPDFEKVKADLQFEMGVKRYEECLSKIREKYSVTKVK